MEKYYFCDVSESLANRICYWLAKETDLDYEHINVIKEDLLSLRANERLKFFSSLPENANARKLFFTYIATKNGDSGYCARSFSVSGHPKDVLTIGHLLRHIEYLGNVGASRNILVRVDGDGSGRISVSCNGYPIPKDSKYNIEQGHNAIVATYDIG